jgi:hypothetical protein
MPTLSDILVPGRECGACTVCCKDLLIDTPELKKVCGELCVHCDAGRGCRIYERRPEACRSWYCGWRVMPQLDDSWRPDISKVLVTITAEDIPAPYRGPGMRIDLLGSTQKILWPPLVNLIGGAIQNRVPVFLSVPGKPGHASGKLFLNDVLAGALANKDWPRARNTLLQAAELCAAPPDA